MYREPHLQKKSDECSDIWHQWFKAEYEDKDEQMASEIRKKWCNCVTEFGKMVSEEVRTNTRYHGIRK